MKKVLDNKELLTQLSSHAREKIVNKYCQTKIWKALLSEYQNATGQS